MRREGVPSHPMKTSFPLLVLLGAFLVPDSAGATRCVMLNPDLETLTLAVDSVTVDGVAVTALEPWRQQARTLQADTDGRVWTIGDRGGEEFDRVP